MVTQDCGVGSCLGRSAPESVCVGFGAGDGNGLEPLAVSAACESIWGVAGWRVDGCQCARRGPRHARAQYVFRV